MKGEHEAPRELKGTFLFGGTIRIGGPDLPARLKRGEELAIEDLSRPHEFYFGIENRLKEQLIEVTPWIDLSDADLEILTPDCDEFGPGASLEIFFRAGRGRHFSLEINRDQAVVLGKICEGYARACAAIENLTGVYHTTAPERDEERGDGPESRVSY